MSKHVSFEARRYTRMAVSTLAELCSSGRSELARIAAAKELLSRGWGQPSADSTVVHQLDAGALQAAAERIIAARQAAALPQPAVPATTREATVARLLVARKVQP